MSARQTDREREMDAEANHFAMCLLIPRDLLQQELDRMGGLNLSDDAAIGALAGAFQVSVTLMAARLADVYGADWAFGKRQER